MPPLKQNRKVRMVDSTPRDRAVNPRVSVDCVVIGFDGTQLCTLLVRQSDAGREGGTDYYKLPGSLIYEDEGLDEAARRVLTELTGLKNVRMVQFRAFGSKDRTRDPKDMRWLERFHSLDEKVDRIVTIAYLALLKIDRRHTRLSHRYEACWKPVKEIGELAFDHNQIVEEALRYIRRYAADVPAALFALLPRKFTAAQLRTLYAVVGDRKMDERNFHKKIAGMNYVVPLEEKEQGVAHRAARYYRFDRVRYNKGRS